MAARQSINLLNTILWSLSMWKLWEGKATFTSNESHCHPLSFDLSHTNAVLLHYKGEDHPSFSVFPKGFKLILLWGRWWYDFKCCHNNCTSFTSLVFTHIAPSLVRMTNTYSDDDWMIIALSNTNSYWSSKLKGKETLPSNVLYMIKRRKIIIYHSLKLFKKKAYDL